MHNHRFKKTKKTLMAILFLTLFIAIAGCNSSEDTSPDNSPDNNGSTELGIGIYTGRIDNNSIEIDVAQNISFTGTTGIQAFRLSETVKEHLDNNGTQYNENSKIAFECYENDNQQWVITDIKPLSEATLEKEYNRFNPREVNNGENIMGLKIASLSIEELDWSEEDKVKAEFDGKITLSGNFTHYDENALLDHQIGFEVSENSAKRLPKLNFDERNDWFVITNHDKAEEEFGPAGSSGAATIVIDKFTIDYRPGTDATNYATLIEVIDKN